MTDTAAERGSVAVELLVASFLGILVVLAPVQLLRTHGTLALQVQADLAAWGGAGWALRTALRDVRRAGADPRQSGLPAFAEAGARALTILRDTNGDGAIDLRSEERVGLFWASRNGGSVSRKVGAQSMAMVSRVAPDGFRLRYFDEVGAEIGSPNGLNPADRRRVRRVEVAIEVRQELGAFEGRAKLRSAASVRVREGL